MGEKINKKMANKVESLKASLTRHFNCYPSLEAVGHRMEKRKPRCCNRNMAAVIKKSKAADVATVE